ncbi:Leucine-rich repeat protein 1 [Holothuria leucospilota]|uniref:Leucine-rich repeat protein 1 n=1 Tax=Holothuria leucospilota TaxID=206669 RepID=A0A9Q1HCM0_HOLLE|nr:Leucine-rich repeat protein 1 [Holothuria leucospilota]
MRISCDVDVVSRLLPPQGLRGKGRSTRTSLAIGKKPCAGSSGGLFLLLCTAKDRNGSKYKLKENVEALFTKFINEGKATIRMKEPAQDLLLSKADPIQLKSFLHAIKLGHQNKELKTSHLTTLTPATVSQIERPKTKMSVLDRKDYPLTTNFPKSLEFLQVSNCKLRRFDSRMLDLRHLRHLNLSSNTIENLPASWGKLCHLTELNLSDNKLKFLPKSFVFSTLSETLHSIDLSRNCLQILPHQLFQFKRLYSLDLSNNLLKSVPYNAGHLSSLKYLKLSKNELQFIPNSFRSLRLEEIDLDGNPFLGDNEVCVADVNSFSPSLLELAGRAVIKRQLPYSPQTIPKTICMYLDTAMKCHCTRVCFKPFSYTMEPYNIHSIAGSVIAVNGRGGNVPMKGVLCSPQCSRLFKKGGADWRNWCRQLN